MNITSTAFQNNQLIPEKYACDGEGINPPLEFEDIPEGTASLALVVDDPDAPSGDFVHWLLWNIDPATGQIGENSVPDNATEGTTSHEEPGYVAPCPPSGTHRYQFKLYALNGEINLPSTATRRDLLLAMEGHVLAEAMLVGLYARS